MTIYMTQKEYGEHREISQQRVSAMVKTGKLAGCFKMISGKKRIDRDKADAALAKNLDKVFNRPTRRYKKTKKVEPSTSSPTSEDQQKIIKKAGLDKKQSLADSQAQKALYDAAIRKLDFEERDGELLKKSDVEKDAYNMARIIRDAILNIPDRISAELASMTDVHVISEKLNAELNQALEELSS